MVKFRYSSGQFLLIIVQFSDISNIVTGFLYPDYYRRMPKNYLTHVDTKG